VAELTVLEEKENGKKQNKNDWKSSFNYCTPRDLSKLKICGLQENTYQETRDSAFKSAYVAKVI